ncbi:hypothetical protein HLH34_18805 [Gluconacetobacter azotocaptans]|uniref:Uncharacterized protein n=2 Tax=Gluconacetobacter azotocaptans TaxID=142834 RepID=A0A7W4PGV4_9PROT|nr:hypothetical protein [Gluconacetobacter azotocaptans]MBB2191984.1 hypothetical protein [Gluconacetobacter azotocaptans]MBM9399986.1 hypothetical protein [Gluconacetobacter azotocaptans]
MRAIKLWVGVLASQDLEAQYAKLWRKLHDIYEGQLVEALANIRKRFEHEARRQINPAAAPVATPSGGSFKL